MRHAEAAYVNADGSMVPDERIVPLSAKGRTQAARQAEALAAIRIDRAICSSLPRTQETARIVLGDRTGVTLEPITPLEEVKPGWQHQIEHLSLDEKRDWVARIANPWIDAHDSNARFIGGETFGEFEARVLPAWAGVLADDSWTTLLAVLHGAVNRLLIHHMLKMPWGSVGIEQDNACINVIDVDTAPHARVILRLLNFTSYNPAKDGLWLTTMEEAASRIAGTLTRQA